MEYGIKNHLEKVFSRIAYSRDIDFPQMVFLYPLYLLSLLYGTIVKVRLALYSSGWLRKRSLGCKVISVGNMTVGGTGKTPTVEFIARRLQEKGLKVAVLSRGYKRTGKGIGIVSDGKDIFLGPDKAGDEPFLLAKRLKGIPVLVGADRYELGMYATERFPLDAIILDDGFQHIRLKRDLDILLVDGEKGFGNGLLIPRGPLREPLSGLRRAGVVLINKAAPDAGIDKVVREWPPEAAIFKSGYRATKMVSLRSGEQAGVERLSGARLTAVSGIANPSSFLNLLTSLGGIVVSEVSFPDHYGYSLEDLDFIMGKAREGGAEIIVTTEKDAVKIEQFEPGTDVPIYYLEIGLDMHGEEQRFMDSVLSGISS